MRRHIMGRTHINYPIHEMPVLRELLAEYKDEPDMWAEYDMWRHTYHECWRAIIWRMADNFSVNDKVRLEGRFDVSDRFPSLAKHYTLYTDAGPLCRTFDGDWHAVGWARLYHLRTNEKVTLVGGGRMLAIMKGGINVANELGG